jgi:hypothetical protein
MTEEDGKCGDRILILFSEFRGHGTEKSMSPEFARGFFGTSEVFISHNPG